MRINKHTYFKIALIGLFLLNFSGMLSAQEKDTKATKKAKVFMAEAEEALANNNFALAEAKYREAIAKDPNLADANYNLGNLYYKNNIAEESSERLQKSATVAQEKALKHKAFHNQGNAFMAQKNYQKAVEAYKNALRNRPSDDQTRYNLAVAKEKLEKEKQNQKDKDKKDKKDQQNKQDKDKQNKDGEQDKKDKSGDGENKDKNEKPSDKENQKNKKDKDKQGDKEDKKQQQPEQEKDGKNKADQQPQPRKGELSKQQIKNLLEAMENQEKKIQDKINAKKAKGQKSNVEKDW